MAGRPKTGIVLSGGGARGAYEVGLIAGMVEVLGLGPDDPPPFQVFTGTSVGAINVSFMAAHAQRGDLGTQALIDVWTRLNLATPVSYTHLTLPTNREV